VYYALASWTTLNLGVFLCAILHYPRSILHLTTRGFQILCSESLKWCLRRYMCQNHGDRFNLPIIHAAHSSGWSTKFSPWLIIGATCGLPAPTTTTSFLGADMHNQGVVWAQWEEDQPRRDYRLGHGRSGHQAGHDGSGHRPRWLRGWRRRHVAWGWQHVSSACQLAKWNSTFLLEQSPC
jgi:hypothetical protein